jgi:uncharacterized RDD family membrane protein YckC
MERDADKTIPVLEGYASIGRRFAALLLDGLIMLVPAAVAHIMIPVAGGILIFLCYAPILESSELKATIGKHLMGIQVVSMSNRKIKFRVALIRNVFKIVSASLLFLGHIMAFFTKHRQALHDLVAETVVVYGRSNKPIVDAWLDSARAIWR